MENVTIFEQGRTDLIKFINNEYKNFDSMLLSHFLNSFNELLDYREEGTHTKPKILFTNNIDAVLKTIPKAYKLQVFEDDDAIMFNSRLKPLIAIAKKEWCIYIENKDDKFIYGICKTFNSLKEKSLITEIPPITVNYRPTSTCAKTTTAPTSKASLKISLIKSAPKATTLSASITPNSTAAPCRISK